MSQESDGHFIFVQFDSFWTSVWLSVPLIQHIQEVNSCVLSSWTQLPHDKKISLNRYKHYTCCSRTNNFISFDVFIGHSGKFWPTWEGFYSSAQPLQDTKCQKWSIVRKTRSFLHLPSLFKAHTLWMGCEWKDHIQEWRTLVQNERNTLNIL